MRYPGGKGKCYQHLINLMPHHDTYIETHLGGGAVLRHKKPALRNIGIEVDPEVVNRWQAIDCGFPLTIQQDDAVSFLGSYVFTGQELVYADPPYVNSSRRRDNVYRFDYTDFDHERLLECLISLPCLVMISGYDNCLYNSKLAHWRKVSFQAKTHVDVRKECVWLNFPEPAALHDARFLGGSFRERQSIKRRRERLQSKIEQMHPVERTELLRWMIDEYGSPQEVVSCN